MRKLDHSWNFVREVGKREDKMNLRLSVRKQQNLGAGGETDICVRGGTGAGELFSKGSGKLASGSEVGSGLLSSGGLSGRACRRGDASDTVREGL